MRSHSYLFFDIEPSIHDVSKDALAKHKAEFVEMIENADAVHVRTYGTLGLKAGTRFMLHIEAGTPEETQSFLSNLVHTPLGQHLTITYSLLGITRPSQYKHQSPQEVQEEQQPPKSEDPLRKYLIVYPFTKTIEWHLLPFEERRKIMGAHVKTARAFSESISQLLLHSFGIDDHEFIVSYETNDLSAFQTLVMELRSTEARRHTLNDTPIFTCIRMSPTEALELI
jgi:chlorite dismutase